MLIHRLILGRLINVFGKVRTTKYDNPTQISLCNKRIAELQQTAGPLKLDLSKIEMSVSRSIFVITNLVYKYF